MEIKTQGQPGWLSKAQRRLRHDGRRQPAESSASAQDGSSKIGKAPGWLKVGLIGLTAGAFLWAWWPTWQELIDTWQREPDYSHGFLVPLLAGYFLWTRRDTCPSRSVEVGWGGLALIVLSVALRYLAGFFSVEVVDGWAMLVWLVGAVWLLGGWRMCWWSLPAIAFLWFMIPLPYRVEHWLSLPLQRVATMLSGWTLQLLGQPALAEGNTILLGEHVLEVEQACSGLRVFMGVVALAFAYILLARRTWWENCLIALAVIPVALISNVVRIVVTGLLYQFASSEAARKFSHDASGWAMIVLAAGLFALGLWYLRRLFPEVEPPDLGELLREQREGRLGAEPPTTGSQKTANQTTS